MQAATAAVTRIYDQQQWRWRPHCMPASAPRRRSPARLPASIDACATVNELKPPCTKPGSHEWLAMTLWPVLAPALPAIC